MTAYQEHQNLPALPDIPGDLSIEHQEFFSRLKELLEAMCGRREDAPAIPQFQMGKYTGNGSTAQRLIEVNFRPRYVRIFPASTTVEKEFVLLDDPNQSIDWDGYSLEHKDSANYHAQSNTNGISDIDDNGFYVYTATGLLDPNIDGSEYHWVAFG